MNLPRAAKTVLRVPNAFAASRLEAFPRGDFPATLPDQKLEDVGKLTVVLDIDETLIHTDMYGDLEKKVKNNSEADTEHCSNPTSDYFKIGLEGYDLKVYRRPHLEWFLKEASQKFELVTFTAGEKFYASKVLSHLDPNHHLVEHRFFRHNCTPLGHMKYTKNLSYLNRPLNRVVLVDNNPMCFLPNPENGIPVSSFYAQEDDTTLKTVMSFLDHLNGKVDVRPTLNQTFRLCERLSRSYPTNSML